MSRGLALALAISGCGRDPRANVETITGLPNLPGGNPLIPEVALYPWPSDLYLADDPSTVTGKRVALPDEALPVDVFSEDTAWHDGFTRAPLILSWFPEGIDPASIPDPVTTSTVDSPVLLVRTDTMTPVPVIAELDAGAEPDLQALIVRPMVGLEPSTTHVVLLRNGLRAADGGDLRVTDAFRALRDDIPTDSDVVEGMRREFIAVNTTLRALDLDPQDVVLGWSFTTRSEEQVVRPLLSMHDQVMAQDLAPWTLVSDTRDDANRLIEGDIEVLDFLDAQHHIHVDANGDAVAQGMRTVRFLLTIPDALDQTRPAIVFGHGFLSKYVEPTWSLMQHALPTWKMSVLSTDFIGLNEDDAVLTVAKLGAGIGELASFADEQLQSQVHFTALARLAREQLAGEVTEDRGAGSVAVIDPDAVHYMGISNGGTQGAVIATASPAFTRAALVVGGGGWAHIMQRAVQWSTMGSILADRYPDPRDLQLVIALSQQHLDPIDAQNWVAHLVDDRFEGRPPVEVTMHMAVQDAQVANITTEWMMRTAGIPVIVPTSHEVPLLDTVTAAAPGGWSGTSAMFVYDEGYPPLPAGNVAPEEDNGAHESVRRLDSYVTQVGAFLETGAIVQVCDGACDPN